MSHTQGFSSQSSSHCGYPGGQPPPSSVLLRCCGGPEVTMRGGYFKSRGSIPSTSIQLMRPFRRSGRERRWGCGSEILKHYFYFQHSSDNGGSRDGVWSAAEQRTGEPVSAGEGGRAKKPQMLAQFWNVSGHTSQRHNVCMNSNDKKGTDSAPVL